MASQRSLPAELGRPGLGSPEFLPGSSNSNNASDSWHLLSTDSRRFCERPCTVIHVLVETVHERGLQLPGDKTDPGG